MSRGFKPKGPPAFFVDKRKLPPKGRKKVVQIRKVTDSTPAQSVPAVPPQNGVLPSKGVSLPPKDITPPPCLLQNVTPAPPEAQDPGDPSSV